MKKNTRDTQKFYVSNLIHNSLFLILSRFPPAVWTNSERFILNQNKLFGTWFPPASTAFYFKTIFAFIHI